MMEQDFVHKVMVDGHEPSQVEGIVNWEYPVFWYLQGHTKFMMMRFFMIISKNYLRSMLGNPDTNQSRHVLKRSVFTVEL